MLRRSISCMLAGLGLDLLAILSDGGRASGLVIVAAGFSLAWVWFGWPRRSQTALLAYARPTPAFASKGRLIRCTVDGLILNLAAVLRTLRPPARASRTRFSNAGAIGGRPRCFPSPLARARPARTRSGIMARPDSATPPHNPTHLLARGA